MQSWKTFGPTSTYNDGDADFYKLTNQLSDQYEWFAPGREPSPEQQPEPEPEKPMFGLTPSQIQALGLSGRRLNTPDPVSGAGRCIAGSRSSSGSSSSSCC